MELASNVIFYHPPTKLGEGNVFTVVCHSVQGVAIPDPSWGTGWGKGGSKREGYARGRSKSVEYCKR